MSTVKQLLASAQTDLAIDVDQRDCQLLLAYCLNKPLSFLYSWPEYKVEQVIAGQYQGLLGRRHEGEPTAYIIGHCEFWSLQLQVTPATLIPRPETEGLVEWGLQLALPSSSKVLDLGTGTGAIALALATEKPDWRICGLDKSADALAVAQKNAASLGGAAGEVEWIQSDWFVHVGQRRFDLLLSNPPYIDHADPHLCDEVARFEPHEALISADNGYADIKTIINLAPTYLFDGGYLLFEHGWQQAGKVRELLELAGFTEVTTRLDLAGHERLSGGRWPRA